MSYTETGVTLSHLVPHDAGVVVVVGNAHPDKVAQCYVNGDLVAWQSSPAPTWSCDLGPLSASDVVFLLAVDPAEGSTNFWAQAFADSDAGNRLYVRIPQTICPHRPGDRWRVYRGAADAAEATIEVFTGPIYPGGRHACGFGSHLGSGFGYDAHEAAGFGAGFGVGEFAFDCELLSWRSDAMGPGAYPVTVVGLDAAGNESAATTMSITLTTYARPAQNLTVAGYAPATDTLVLSFTESQDIQGG